MIPGISAGGRRAEAAAVKAGGCEHLHMRAGKLVDEPGGERRLPLVVDAPVGGEGDGAVFLGPCDPDIGQPAFLLHALKAAFVHGALRGEEAVFPARQEHHRKLQPLGCVQAS